MNFDCTKSPVTPLPKTPDSSFVKKILTPSFMENTPNKSPKNKLLKNPALNQLWVSKFSPTHYGHLLSDTVSCYNN